MQPESHSIPNTAAGRNSSGTHGSGASGVPSLKEQSKTSALPEHLRNRLAQLRRLGEDPTWVDCRPVNPAAFQLANQLLFAQLEPGDLELLAPEDIRVDVDGDIEIMFYKKYPDTGNTNEFTIIVEEDNLRLAGALFEADKFFDTEELDPKDENSIELIRRILNMM